MIKDKKIKPGFADSYKRYDTSKGFGNGREWREHFYSTISDKEALKILQEETETPCQILGITEDATQDEIKRAFRKKITEWHPDLNQHRIIEATEMSKKIIAAYSLLYKN